MTIHQATIQGVLNKFNFIAGGLYAGHYEARADKPFEQAIRDAVQTYDLTSGEMDSFLEVHPDLFTDAGRPYLDDDVDEQTDKFYENLEEWVLDELYDDISNANNTK